MNHYYDPRIGRLFRMTGFRVTLRGDDFIFYTDFHRTILQVNGYDQAILFAKGVQAGHRYPMREFPSEYMCQPWKPSTKSPALAELEAELFTVERAAGLTSFRVELEDLQQRHAELLDLIKKERPRGIPDQIHTD